MRQPGAPREIGTGMADRVGQSRLFAARGARGIADGRRAFTVERVADEGARPTRETSMPSATSRSMASITVVRDTPVSFARVRVAGSRSPARRPPDRITSRRPWYSWTLMLRRELRSSRIDDSNAPAVCFIWSPILPLRPGPGL